MPFSVKRNFFICFWLIVLGAVLLLWTPLLNGYPIISSDSGTYIYSGARVFVPADRPIGYGLFIQFVNPIDSLWGVVILQALATSYLLFRNAVLLLPPTRWRFFLAFGIVALTTLLTAVSTFVGFISPDIFASWLFLGILLLVASPHLYDRVLASFLILISFGSHSTHLALAMGALVLFAAISLLVPRWRQPLKPPTLILSGLVGITALALIGLNYFAHHDLTLARGGTTVLLNRLVTSGVMTETLDASCGTEDWRLCRYRAILAAPHADKDWYLWASDSPVQEVGWDENVVEQRAIITRALQCCLPRIVQTSVEEAWAQFWLTRSGGYTYLDDHWNAVQAIREVYPRESDQFTRTVQQSGQTVQILLLPYDEAQSQAVCLGVLLVLLVISLILKNYSLAALVGALLLFLAANAAVVGTFNGAAGRYQGRIAWLTVYVALLSGVVLYHAYRRQPAPVS